MNRLIFTIIFLLMCVQAHAGTVQRYFTYGPTSTVTSVNLNGNFDNILNSLNGDLDNNNADVDGGFRFIEILAALPAAGNQGRVVFLTADNTLNFDTGSVWLATALLGSNQTFSGDNTFSGTTTLSGDTNISGSLTVTGNSTFAGTTISDLGSVTTADINGGTLDGVQVGGTTATGELLVNNSSDGADGLGDQGTANEVLQSAGAGANPTWVPQGAKFVSTTSGSGTNTGNISIDASKEYLVTFYFKNDQGNPSYLYLRFNSSSTATAYEWGGTGKTFEAVPTETSTGDDSDAQIVIADDGDYVDDLNNGDGYAVGKMFINTNKTTENISSFVTGDFNYQDDQGADGIAQFGGIYREDVTISDFEFVSDQTLSYVVRVYELGQ